MHLHMDRDDAAKVIVFVFVTDADDTEADSIADIVAALDQISAMGEAGHPNGAIAVVVVGVGDQSAKIIEALGTEGAVFNTATWGLPALLDEVIGSVAAVAEIPPNMTYTTSWMKGIRRWDLVWRSVRGRLGAGGRFVGGSTGGRGSAPAVAGGDGNELLTWAEVQADGTAAGLLALADGRSRPERDPVDGGDSDTSGAEQP
jgi:hypothetical protein